MRVTKNRQMERTREVEVSRSILNRALQDPRQQASRENAIRLLGTCATVVDASRFSHLRLASRRATRDWLSFQPEIYTEA